MGHPKYFDWRATLVLLVACLFVAMSGCDFGGVSLTDLQEWFANQNNPPAPVMGDTIVDPATCLNLGQAQGPEFISGGISWDYPVNPDSVVWNYGNYSGPLLDVLYTAGFDMGVPIDSVTVWATDTGFAYIVDGTANHTPWLVQIWTFASSTSGGMTSYGWPEAHTDSRSAKWYLPATSKSFYFGPTVSFDQLKAAALSRPNVEAFALRGLVADTSQFMELGGIILGDCIEGRKRADFRWGTWEPFIFDYYKSAGWDQVITP